MTWKFDALITQQFRFVCQYNRWPFLSMWTGWNVKFNTALRKITADLSRQFKQQSKEKPIWIANTVFVYTLNILAWYLLKWIHVGTLSKAVAQRKSNMNTFKCEATESAHSAVCTIQESQTPLSGVEEVNICMKLLNQLVRVWLNNCNTTGVISGPKSFLGSLSVAPTGIWKGGPTLKKGASGRERVRRVTGAGTSGPVC